MSNKDPNHYYSRGLFFKNYDLYDTEGVDGPAKDGPGTGLHSGKYKSVTDFLQQKRNKRLKKRKLAFAKISDENNIDFPTDNLSAIMPFDGGYPNMGLVDSITPNLDDGNDHFTGSPYYGTKDNADPLILNNLGIEDGNQRFVDEEPNETKNLYYGISNVKTK